MLLLLACIATSRMGGDHEKLSSIPETSIIQKRHSYTRDLNSETSGDSETVSTLWRCFSSWLCHMVEHPRQGCSQSMQVLSQMKACSKSTGFPSVYCLTEAMGMAAGMSKEDGDSPDSQTDWEAAWKALLWSFAAASVYTLLASWIPAIHSFPVASWLGMRVVTDWGWEVTPSMGYIGQGMIMGPKTAFSMLAGAVVGTLHDHFLTPDAFWQVKLSCHF